MTGIEQLRGAGFTAISVPLSQRMWAIIDLEDAPLVLSHRWCAVTFPTAKSFYAARNQWRRTAEVNRQGRRGISRHVYMHAQIMGEKGIDHINGDGLNNRRSNLRKASKAENAHNERGLRSLNTSGFRGVTFYKRTGKWHAKITANGRRVHLGYFLTAEEAAAAYDTAAAKFYGEFAATNKARSAA